MTSYAQKLNLILSNPCPDWLSFSSSLLSPQLGVLCQLIIFLDYVNPLLAIPLVCEPQFQTDAQCTTSN